MSELWKMAPPGKLTSGFEIKQFHLKNEIIKKGKKEKKIKSETKEES